MESREKITALADEMIKHNRRKKTLDICVIVLLALFIVEIVLLVLVPIIVNSDENGIWPYLWLYFSIAPISMSFITSIICVTFNFKSKNRTNAFQILSIVEIVGLSLLLLLFICFLKKIVPITPEKIVIAIISLVVILALVLFVNYLMYHMVKNPIYKRMLTQIKKNYGREKSVSFNKTIKKHLHPKHKVKLIELLEEQYSEEMECDSVLINDDVKNDSVEKTTKYNYKYDSQLLEMLDDPSNSENVDLIDENGKVIKFEQEYVCPLNGKLYCILKPLDKMDNVEDDEAFVFALEEDGSTGKHTLKVVKDDELADKVFDSYYQDLDNQENLQNSEVKKVEVNNFDPIKEKKSYLISTIFISIIYALIIVIGILGVTEVLGNILNSMAYDGESSLAGEALSYAIGMIFFSFVPSIGYFFAFNKLYDIKKKYRVLIFLISLILSLVMVIVFFVAYNSTGCSEAINDCDGSSYEQILTICVSHIGLLITYLLTFLKIDYRKLNRALSKFKNNASDEPSSTKFLVVILAYLKQFLKLIARVFILLVRGTLKLRDRSKPLYYSLFTVIFTVLCFFTSFIALVIIIGLALSLLSLAFFGTLSFADTPTSSYVYEINEDGYTRTLKYYDYYNGHDRYKDDIGNYWYTDDYGTTFYKE